MGIFFLTTEKSIIIDHEIAERGTPFGFRL